MTTNIMNVLGGGNGGPETEGLIRALMSSSNEERGQAELVFEECKKHPDALAGCLVQTLQHSQAVELRAMCAILLRKVITKDSVSLWPQLSRPTQNAVKAQLLHCVQQEEVKTISKKLSDTVAELAAGIYEEGLWPELLPFMFQCVSSNSDRLKESALLIFAQLGEYIGSSLHPYLSTLHDLFATCLSSTTSSDVRLAALKAAANFIQTLDKTQLDRFQDLLPGMMQTLLLAIQMKDEATAQEALEMMIELAGITPRFLRRQLPDVVAAMLQVAEAEDLEEGTRHLAVEFLVTLTEARDKAPGMMRKLPQFVGRLFALLMKMLLDIEDDISWHTAEREEDAEDGESDNYNVAEECLDRLAMSLKGKTILPVASQLLPPYISDPDWKKRHAALMTLAQIAEGCSKVMVKSLEQVVNMVLGSFADPHPRVRWAAIHAMGQLATDLGPDLQNDYHGRIIPALIKCMDDVENPRVQAHATAAILNFTEACTAEIMAVYLNALISKLLMLLQNGKRMVQEGALTALASVADCSQGQFEQYYDVVMPYLKTILINANSKEDRILRAKSMECISLVGMAVGKDKFRADAKQVMEVLMGLQGVEMEDDDPTISYMLQAWARLCKCLGQEFLPYMGVVMPPLLRSAQLKPDVTITDADSDIEDEDDDDSVETIQIGDKRIGIRTSVLEEKATACNMLGCYADELKEGFYPWIDQVAPILVPLLKFYFHEEVRKAAVSAMPELLRAGKLAVEKGQAHPPEGGAAYVKRLSDLFVPPLVDALKKEPEPEICACMLDALNDCIQIAGPVMEAMQIKAMVDEFKQVMIKTGERKQERAERTQTEDFDDEEGELLEEENETEDEVFDQIGECVGTLVKTFKLAFLPYFEELLPFILQMLSKERTAEERRVAICIFDDVAEHAGEAAVKYYDAFLPLVLDASTDSNCNIRQAAVYGIGICAQFGGAKFKPLVNESLARLTSVVAQPDSRSKENVSATENAISAVGRICAYQRDCIDGETVVPGWLGCLPLKEDLVEAKFVHELLCSMVERNDPHLLGANNKNLPKIISVFAEVLAGGGELATEQTAARMVAVIRHLQTVLPSDMLASTWASLPPPQQAALQAALSSQPSP